MHSVLHVSEMAIQDIVENLVQRFSLSKLLVKDSVIGVSQEHDQSISDALLHESVEAIVKSHVFVSASSEGAELSTAKRRKTFVSLTEQCVENEHCFSLTINMPSVTLLLFLTYDEQL